MEGTALESFPLCAALSKLVNPWVPQFPLVHVSDSPTLPTCLGGQDHTHGRCAQALGEDACTLYPHPSVGAMLALAFLSVWQASGLLFKAHICLLDTCGHHSFVQITLAKPLPCAKTCI